MIGWVNFWRSMGRGPGLEGAIFKIMQRLGLQTDRQFTDFIQKNVSGLGSFKLPGMVAECSGTGILPVFLNDAV